VYAYPVKGQKLTLFSHECAHLTYYLTLVSF